MKLSLAAVGRCWEPLKEREQELSVDRGAWCLTGDRRGPRAEAWASCLGGRRSTEQEKRAAEEKNQQVLMVSRQQSQDGRWCGVTGRTVAPLKETGMDPGEWVRGSPRLLFDTGGHCVSLEFHY